MSESATKYTPIEPLGFPRVNIFNNNGRLEYYAGSHVFFPGTRIRFAHDGDTEYLEGVIEKRTDTVRRGGALVKVDILVVNVDGFLIVLSESHGAHIVGRPINPY